ncbi:hypothetical protein JKA74_20385 [Marivirga sp. S37H4]|uniref:Uncharacterized protein n=1 Tax=Marivirga aurantiaca TaxID=2802615 RepID=A0A934X2R8_9BACT|nr:hypothetical protein [Marivirga aurantiaca]MBK6267411.1 hypothetical protein [Marivirga aurantiaca]
MSNAKLKNGFAALVIAAVCFANVALHYVPANNEMAGAGEVVYKSSVYDADGATYAATPAVILTARAAALVTKAAVRSAVAYTLVCSFCGNEPQEELAINLEAEKDMRLAQLN